MRRRPIVNPEAAVAQSVADLLNKFEYPDLDTQPLPALIGGGGGAPTVVVAASDATGLSKSKADFICPGVNDHETLQAAVDLITNLGGRLLLTEGTFDIGTGNWFTFSQDEISIQGMGPGTIITTSSTSGNMIDLEAGTFLSDMQFRGASGTRAIQANDRCMIHRVYIDTDGDGIRIDGGDSIVLQCRIDAGRDGLLTTGGTNTSVNIVETHVTAVRDGIVNIGGSLPNSVIMGCLITAGGNGLDLVADRSIIAANWIDADEHGIRLTTTDEAEVYGNQVVEPGQDTDNTFDGIVVTGVATRNHIHDNKITPSTAGNAPRYGINIQTTSECNIVVGNDLGDCNQYGSDCLNDNGANTQLFYPADATYGDNFTDCGTGS